jgi:hypothetical protein
MSLVCIYYRAKDVLALAPLRAHRLGLRPLFFAFPKPPNHNPLRGASLPPLATGDATKPSLKTPKQAFLRIVSNHRIVELKNIMYSKSDGDKASV